MFDGKIRDIWMRSRDCVIIVKRGVFDFYILVICKRYLILFEKYYFNYYYFNGKEQKIGKIF